MSVYGNPEFGDWVNWSAEIAQKNGFRDDAEHMNIRHFIALKIALVHSELSELLEEIRKPDIASDKVYEELADVFIRLFDLTDIIENECGQSSTFASVEDAMFEKTNTNKKRPRMHGKAF